MNDRISTPEMTYLLYADTEQEKDDWIGRVGKAIVRCSSTYYSQQQQQQPAQAGGGMMGQQYQQYQQGGQPAQQYAQSNYNNDDDDDIYNDINENSYFND